MTEMNTFCASGSCPEAIVNNDYVYVVNNAPFENQQVRRPAYDNAYVIPKDAWVEHGIRVRSATASGEIVAAHQILVEAAEGKFNEDRLGMSHDIDDHFPPQDLEAIAAAFAAGGVWELLEQNSAPERLGEGTVASVSINQL